MDARRFYAKINPDKYNELDTLAKEQAKTGYQNKSAGSGANERVYWRRVSSNNPYDATSNPATNNPVNVPTAAADHTGVESHAKVEVDFGNNVKLDATSNTVTVKPDSPQIEKFVSTVVHSELSRRRNLYL